MSIIEIKKTSYLFEVLLSYKQECKSLNFIKKYFCLCPIYVETAKTIFRKFNTNTPLGWGNIIGYTGSRFYNKLTFYLANFLNLK